MEGEILHQIQLWIDIPYLVMFISISYLVKRHFGEWARRVTGQRVKTVHIVLIIALVTGILFYFFSETLRWEQILLTYTLGTSLHEVLFKYVENLFTNEKNK